MTRARLLVAWAALAAAALAGCETIGSIPLPRFGGQGPSDEARIRDILDDVEDAIENRKVYRALSYVSQTYADAEGRDYSDLQKYLSRLVRLYHDIRIERAPPAVQVSGDRAVAYETFGANANTSERLSGPPVNLQGQMTVYFERIDDRWMIVEWGSVQ